jgi:predicted glycoside hydrolase/deacetylase ChbG (UPF0249 family)
MAEPIQVITQLVETVILPLAGIVLAYLAAKYGVKFAAAKKLLEAIATETEKVNTMMEAVEDALYDDKVTEEEYRDMYEHLMELKAATEALVKVIKELLGIVGPQ